MKNKITSITFLRGEGKAMHNYATDKNSHQIIINLKNKIPGLGYGSKEIRKMLKEWDKSTGNFLT